MERRRLSAVWPGMPSIKSSERFGYSRPCKPDGCRRFLHASPAAQGLSLLIHGGLQAQGDPADARPCQRLKQMPIHIGKGCTPL